MAATARWIASIVVLRTSASPAFIRAGDKPFGAGNLLILAFRVGSIGLRPDPDGAWSTLDELTDNLLFFRLRCAGQACVGSTFRSADFQERAEIVQKGGPDPSLL
jgi:hypothetical protein